MKHLFIVNPIAGGKNMLGEVERQVSAAFAKRSDEYEIYSTTAPMDATEKIKTAAESGEALRVYACGGDGTFNECVCGAVGHDNVAVCPFPVGTGNDFCRMFGEEKELFRDLDALLNGWEHPIDVINCNGRACVNICSVGIDARVGTGVHRYDNIPLIGGAAGYVVSAVVEVFRGINQQMRVRCGDFESDGMHSLVCACNGRFYGGGFNPSLTAMPDDGKLDLFVVRKVSLLELPFLIGKYAAGRADEMKTHVTHLEGDSITVEFDKETIVNIDGEAIFTKKAVMTLLPGAVKLIVPAGMKFFGRAS